MINSQNDNTPSAGSVAPIVQAAQESPARADDAAGASGAAAAGANRYPLSRQMFDRLRRGRRPRLGAILMALVAVVILVKLVGRIWLVRGHHRRGRHAGGRWLTAPSALVLLCVLAGAVVLLVDLAYWGLFPMLL